jgi:uridine kinase
MTTKRMPSSPSQDVASSAVVPGRPRERAQARMADGRIFEAPIGTPLLTVLRAIQRPADLPPIAAVINGRLRELSALLSSDSDVAPVTLDDPDGVRIYRRSLVFLLVVAAAEIFPDAEVFIEHSATTAAGYFCEVRNRAPFQQEELRLIEVRMREIVAEDAPIEKVVLPLAEAIKIFDNRRETDKARVFSHRRKETVALYSLRGRVDHFHGYMAPSAGCLDQFALSAFPPGFMLSFPHQGRARELPPATPYPKLFAVFEEAGNWLDRLGIRGAGALNDAIADGRLPEISLVAEALHEAKLAEIATQIAARHTSRIVLVAGPSSSGKTTFAKRLAVQLLTRGRRTFALGLDDYFVSRDCTPRDAEGKLDYETLDALDLPLFNRHLLDLIAGKTVELPRYNFITGTRERGHSVCLGSDDVVVVEGIHGLNPRLLSDVAPEMSFRIYVSALTQLNIDRHNRVSTADSRLVRRMVRDAAQRGYSPEVTLSRWGAVARGEKQHIFPYQENADCIFNSALVHELAVLRPLAEPLLLQVRPESPAFIEANRILSFLQWFEPAPPRHVPDNSILREFIGGSILEGFKIWPAAPLRAQAPNGDKVQK